MAYTGKKLADMKGAERRARIAQLVKNPATRHLVADADLPANLRAKRQLNTRLNAPIVPGGTTTNRDLAHQREAAVTLEYGPNAVGSYQQREKDIGGWYDEYRRQLGQHTQNVQGYGQQALQQTAGLSNVQGGPAPVDPGNQSDAQKAQAVRDVMLGAQRQQLAGQGTAANTYADTLANVVAPGQKVQALTEARGKTDELKQKMGAFRADYENKARTQEGNVVVAKQVALGKDAVQGAQLDKTAAETQKTKAETDFFKEHGYYPPTGPPKKPAAKSPDVITSGAFAGYTKTQVAGMSPAKKQQLKDDYANGKGSGKDKTKPTTGPGSLTPDKEQQYVSQIQTVYDKLANPPKWDYKHHGGRRKTPTEVLAELRDQNLDPRVLNVARSLFHNKGKGIGKFGLSNAHELGIHVGGRWKVI